MDDDCVSTDCSSGCELSDASSREAAKNPHSLDDEFDYKPPSTMAPTEEEIQTMRLYRPQMFKSKGFYVDGESYSGRVVYFSEVALDEPFWTSRLIGRDHYKNVVDLTLERYNEIKGSTATCESIVRALLTKVNGYKLYITFMARESPGGDLVEYQAKTERKFSQRNYHAILCRPTPKPKD